MKIDASSPFHKPKDFLKNEAKTVKFLKDDPEIAKHFTRLYSDANSWYSQNYKQIEKKNLSKFLFESEIDVLLDGREGICHIGAVLIEKSGQFDLMSYYLALCEAGNTSLIRKYHFDYARADKQYRQAPPVYHMQYPGELSGRLKGLQIVDNQLHPWLSEPRLSFTPMSLALLLNIVFKEFSSEVSKKIVERGEWRDLIRNNEDTILKPYYQNCNRFINSPAGQLITNDFFYGK